jgi:hypothetical protein
MNDNLICKINFIIFLDNNGNRLYSKFYDKNLQKNQKEFEINLSKFVINNNIQRNDVDIFIFDNYTIISKISPEIAIFIGSEENTNEILLVNFYDTLEYCLFNIIENSLTKEKLLKNYDKIVILIDELINDGLIMNVNVDNIDKIIKLEDDNFFDSNENNNNSNENKSGFGGFFKNLFFSSNDENNNNIFGSLINDASNYVNKNINQ